MTVQEAADAFGVTVEAIRGRMHRGKYLKEKDGEGRVWVLLSPDQLPNGRGEVRERFTERSGLRSGERSRADGPNVYKRRDFDAEELVEEMRSRIEDLRDQLAEEREARRRADMIVMQLTQTNAALAARVPELEASPVEEPRDGRETDAEGPGVEEEAPGNDAGVQTGAQRRERPWWRRFFGFE